MRKFCVQSVTRLARSAVTDVIRDHDKILLGIEQLSFTEQHPAESTAKKLRMAAARSVQNKHRICNHPILVLDRRPERHKMQPQFRQNLAALKPKILHKEIAWRGLGITLAKGIRRRYKR